MRTIGRLACVTAVAFSVAATVVAAATNNIRTVAGTGTGGVSGNGGPAAQANVGIPVGVTALPDGGYLTAEQIGVVRRVSPAGIITLVAGNGTAGFSGDDGPATSAQMNAPSAAVMTPDGGYLIADPNNNRIRRVSPAGIMTTVVGTGSASYGGDNGSASEAQINFPFHIALHPTDGSYLIADTDNNRIRRVAANGIITTVAGNGSVGSGGDGGPAILAGLADPSGVAFTPDGGFLIADTNNNRIRKVSAGGTITRVAGTGTAGSLGDNGPAVNAQLNAPIGIAVDAGGGYVIGDRFNNKIRRVSPGGTITTVAGTGAGSFSGDNGPAASATLNNPFGVAVTVEGDILFADTSNHRVRYVDISSPGALLTGTSPASPADDNAPEVRGLAPPGSSVSLYTNAGCSGAPVATGMAPSFASPGFTAKVGDNTTTTFFARLADIAGFAGPCSTSSVTYREVTLPPPKRGRTVNVVPVSGRVLVAVPGSGKRRAGEAHAAASRFVPLEEVGAHVPVGSTLDTRKGTVQLFAARDTTGRLQNGRFSGGLFVVGQTRKNPLTTVSMTGGGFNACSRLPRGGSKKEQAGTAARKRKRRRRLFSNVKGRFRARGRNSTATTRGTKFTVVDTCSGTRTSVSQGSVVVRDLTLRRNRTVKAGRSYLAKPPKRK